MDLARFVGVRNDIKTIFQGPNRDDWIIRDLPSTGCVSPRGGVKKNKKSKIFKFSVWISMDAGRLPKVRGALGKAWGGPGT